jgi:hypothetical protein
MKQFVLLPSNALVRIGHVKKVHVKHSTENRWFYGLYSPSVILKTKNKVLETEPVW